MRSGDTLRASGRATPVAVGFAVAAVLAQISYPLVSGGVKDAVTFCVVALLAAACVTHAASARGAGWATLMVLLTAGIGLTAEIIGTRTGMPFGCYEYAQDRIGPSLAHVPVVVPFAWTAGLYPVWCAATVVAQRMRRPVLTRVGLTTVGVVGWDLYLDPQMVADGQWTWCSPFAPLPGLDGIPWTNYVGWLLVAALMAVAMEVLGRSPMRTPTVSPLVPWGLFVWTWLGSALAHAVFLPDLGWSALYGLVAMGVVGVPFLLALSRPRSDIARDAPRRADRPVH
ncbi:carotenoid biosynthesis protein [Rhodococcus sp. BP-149]|uniref:carotenoid biosynthesis protein n=1 Tax=unclassified Rhodococcus (in: high G+C Gram-positive bacteria) TaxID=192944 RepID=UPI00068F81FC|nr:MULTISPECIES: carotenoid biosynthesis protein [unclassified Rhodococcus (in: high G+C Gram-positive bacteria)]MBY6676000.1 carotenoid biosynthesis protein [Rhodococcus sp. BP-332]MBY6686026.1 carotenoid biosynthesis protein [Rhodococcus sp. BP-288]MBY6696097.1 carotenoid biosynthesis protein [Rhodococcus sp. BP-188]MBY6700694.1 carotenoid biosynthesis protein [Rhodococcus sp. BP-285]MBY6703198.1 carotenoid biosynthesis protein [Rhodococcus sp. BP-283]